MTSPIVITERQADYLDTERSTAQTVQEMCGHIRAAAGDPLVRAVALEVVDGDPLQSVWAWCKKNIRFVTDEEQLEKLLGRRDELELLISPSVLMRARDRQGDCDDFTMMVCAMLRCLGITPLIKTFKCHREEPWRWSHVCAAALLPDGSVFPLDASHGEFCGWEVPKQDQFKTQLWDMNGRKVGAPQGMGSTRRSRGLSGYVSDRNWTGTPETTVRGPHAGAYPSLDFTRMYSGRRSGLGAIARGKFGMGAIVCDDSGINCYDDGTTSAPAPVNTDPNYFANLSLDYNAPGANYIDTVTGQPINGATGQIISNPTAAQLAAASSSSFNLSNFLSSLIAPATALTAKALTPGAQVLANGSILLPNGQVVAGTPAVSSSNVLLIGGIVIAAVLVLSMGKK